MAIINEQNIIIVLGDLGAGTNYVKNTLLLSQSVDFPWCSADRLSFIQNSVYPQSLTCQIDNWIKLEYRLRSWKQFYGVDIADNFADINTQKVCEVTQQKKIVFISHWPDTANTLKEKYPNINIISLFAQTQKEIDWQVSQYISKIGINSLQNFTFPDNVEQQKKEFVDKNGIGKYQQLNATNMREILYQRKDSYYNQNYVNIQIEQLQQDSWIDDVVQKLNVEIDLTQAKQLAKIWRDRNPPYIEYWKQQTYEN